MAGESGTPDSRIGALELPEALRLTPWSVQFFQAVRLLQYYQPRRSPVGRFAEPRQEAARFRAHRGIGFPPADIRDLEFPADQAPQLSVNFMGLTGPSGELPLFYSAYVAERVRSGDATTADFFDIFNHRFISLLYRAWEKYRFTLPYERGEAGGMKQYLMDLIGIGTDGLANRQAVDDESLVFYSGLLGQQPRSSAALRNILCDYFNAPAEVVEFVGAWRRLEESGQCRLEEEDQGLESSRLGGGAVVGDEVWDPQSIVRLRLGPLSLGQYLDFLPTGSAWRPLKAITRFFSGDDLDFEVQLILKRTEAPACQLGAEGIEAPRLGWVSWVKTRPMPRDPDETILRLWEDTKSDERQPKSSR